MCQTRKVVFEQKKSILFVNIKKWKRQNLPTRLLKVSVNQKVDLITCETHYSWFQKPQTFIAEAAFTASLKHKKLSIRQGNRLTRSMQIIFFSFLFLTTTQSI